MHHGRPRWIWNALALGIALLWATGIAAQPAGMPRAAPKPARLMLLWSPQAQFAGYYVALDKGIYARHGIDLEIRAAGPGQSPAQALEEGAADFAVLWLTTALQLRSRGQPVVHLAQIIQTSSMMLVARKDSGIRSVADMNGRKVGLWPGDLAIPPRTLFLRHGIAVREVPQSLTVNLFLRGGIDVASAMWFNEYHTILNAGVDPDELQAFFLRDAGLNFPEDGLYALRGTVDRDPALADAFVRASLEGWRYAFAQPEEALDIVMRYVAEAHLPANRVHQRWMLNRMRDLAVPAGAAGGMGVLAERDYRAVAAALLQAGLIRDWPDYRDFARRPDAGT